MSRLSSVTALPALSPLSAFSPSSRAAVILHIPNTAWPMEQTESAREKSGSEHCRITVTDATMKMMWVAGAVRVFGKVLRAD